MILTLTFYKMDLRIYLYITLVIRRMYCSEHEQFYVRSINKQDRKFTNTVLKESTASNLVQCAGLCLITSGCQDFTFSQSICKLYGVTDNSQPVQHMTLFEKVASTFTVTTLPRGVLLTYAYIKAYEINSDSHTKCEKLGSRLIILDSVEKLDYIREALMLDQEYTDVNVDGYRETYSSGVDPRENWYFANGETMPYEVWSPGFPDTQADQLCIQMWDNNDYRLDDTTCEGLKHYYMCEK